ncbi:MAG: hypothetical protein ACKPKO_46040, partial [Candidatus Fonsibacter sp.]
FRCRLHAWQHFEALTLSLALARTLSRLYSMTLFFCTGGHFARMVKQLPALVRQLLVIKPVAVFGPPPPAAGEYAREVLSLILAHFVQAIPNLTDEGVYAGRESDDDNQELDLQTLAVSRNAVLAIKSPKLRKFVQAVVDLAAICKGPWWTTAAIVHYCVGPTCCVADLAGGVPTERARAEQRMAAAMQQVWFPVAPNTPALNKLGKLALALDL